MVTSTNVRSLVVGGLLVSLNLVQSPQPSPSIIVVVDSTSVVRDRARAIAQVRTLLTVAAANPASVTCFDLQAKGAEELNHCLIDSYITDLFPEEPRVYSGVSLDLREANAILARNEAVRDQVIGRECAAARRSSGCEGAVHGAAVARLADAQSETERKLAALAGVIGTRHPTLVILVTAGMPFRYEPTAVRRLVDVLRTGRTQLVHAAPESPFKIEGLLRDAAATLVSNAGGRRVNLT